MSDTVKARPLVRIDGSDQAPACFSPSWIPDIDVFPELSDALRENQRLRAAWDATASRRRELEGRVEADAKRRNAALRDAYLSGDQNTQMESEDETLKAELSAAKEHSQAAVSAFVEHINQTIAIVAEHGQEWADEIAAYNANINSEIEAVLTKARELRERFGNFARLDHWIYRTVSGATEMPVLHQAYSDIEAPPSGNPDEEEARLRAFMERSYAGGMPGSTLISDEEGKKLEEQVLHPGDTPTDESITAAHLQDDDLVDWLMGCGMFDGKPLPSADQVVMAAGDDPDIAQRLINAERTANPETTRQAVIDQLTHIASGGTRV
jgi:hypothetical protein